MYGLILAISLSCPMQCTSGDCAVQPILHGPVAHRVVERPLVRRVAARVRSVQPVRRLLRVRLFRGRLCRR